ncbi:MAG: plasmid stabilization protein [Phycisphaerales bacterium]
MPRGDKSSYSTKQRRQARHIEDSYESHGSGTKKAERIAWATVNKQDGGAKGPGERKGAGARGSRSKKSMGKAGARRSTSKSR